MNLPREWSRGPQWAGARARAEWAPVLASAQAAWNEIEVASITEGVRQCALIFVTPEELVTASRDCAGVGLEVQVLAVAGAQLRVAVHRPGLAATWHLAWHSGNDRLIGELLGFPPCCLDFFEREWVGAARRDVTPAMRSIEGPWEANPFLRSMGVRLVPHLPCSADCEPTVLAARSYLEAGRRAGADVASLERLLRLPVDVDALGGVALVSTPPFRFMTAADSGARRAHRASQVVDETPAPIDAPWADNGFSSQAAMTAAHVPVLQAVGRVRSALDLGCGDGALLEKLARQVGWWSGDPGRWVGVEADEGRASRGAARRGPLVQVLHGTIEDPDLAQASDFDVAVIMPGRLLEMSADDASRVRAALPRVARRLVVYSYEGDLAALCRRAGIAISSSVYQNGGAQAAEGKVA